MNSLYSSLDYVTSNRPKQHCFEIAHSKQYKTIFRFNLINGALPEISRDLMRNGSVEARGVLKLSDIFHTELFSTYIKHIKDEIIRHRNKIIKVFISELNK